MRNEIEFERLRLFARNLMGKAELNEYIEWAIKELLNGNDTPSVQILAGLEAPFNFFETYGLFKKAVKELQIDFNQNKLIEEYAKELAERKLNNLIESDKLIEEMGSIIIYSSYDSKYDGWLNLIEFFHDYYVLGQGNLEDDILEECRNQIDKIN